MKNYMLAVLLFVGLMAQGQEHSPEFRSDFVHVVLFWLENPDSEGDREEFEENLETLLQDSQHTLTNYMGTPPVASRDVVDASFDYMLIVTFPSAAEQEAYQGEQAHLEFIENTQALWKKVVVYDAEGKTVNRK